MNKIFLLAALFCLLVSTTNPMNAQLIIRNSGHAEIGHDPFDPVPAGLNPDYYNWLDTVTTLKVFGNRDEFASGAHMTFGDNLLQNQYNVCVGELGYIDTDCLWLQGRHGMYFTGTHNAADTIVFFDYNRSDAVNFRKDINTSGVFIQSDERFKENVMPLHDVLLSLDNLEAVTYTLKNNFARQCRDALSDMPVVTSKDAKDKELFDRYFAGQEKGSNRYGFLAQNVKDVFPELVHTDQSGYMYVDYIGLIPILVQSINELRAQLAEVKGEQAASPMMQSPQQSGQIEANLHAAKLYQNAPNPWSSETVIRYSLPQSVAQAMIYIYDMQGKQLKSIPAQGRGDSQVTITARDLTAGMYLYALVADGALIDSKQMVLTK